MKTILLKQEDVYRGSLILINREHKIQKNISLDDLTRIDDRYPTILLEKTATQRLRMILERISGWDKIVPVSGYRSLEEQTSIYQTSIQENGETFTNKYVALPQKSEHQTGLAIDLGLKQEYIDFIRPSFPRMGISEKFRKIAYQYGFIERYQEEKQDITKIASEEWHFRYVGYPHSEIIRKFNFCLEEYHEFLKRYPYPVCSFSYKDYEISYLSFESESFKLNLGDMDMISGNNSDGFIITKRK